MDLILHLQFQINKYSKVKLIQKLHIPPKLGLINQIIEAIGHIEGIEIDSQLQKTLEEESEAEMNN